MSVADQVRSLADPIAAGLSVELVDVVHDGGILRVTIDRPGGVDIDAISAVTRALSRALDEADPLPGRYTLEVSSPGLERPLRTPDHFVRAVGSEVAVRARAGVDGERRVHGTLLAADHAGITVRDPDTLVERTLSHAEIEKARTVFAWAPPPKPGGGGNRRKKAGRP